MSIRVEVLKLSEYGESVIDDDLAQLVEEKFWTALGITLSKHPRDAGWRVKADALSGIARAKTRNLDLTVRIEPKLADADLVFLADYAYGQRGNPLRRPDAARVGVDSQHNDPIATLLIWYVNSVSDFATRWLRRSYRSRRVTLDSRVRGRVLIGPFLTRSLTSGRANEIPCVVTERTIDTANNQVLKAGLRRVAKLAMTLPVPAARRAVRRAVSGALPRFAEVSDVEIGPGQIRATTAKGPERHYESILATTLDLLEGRFLGQTLGQAQVESFLWSMPHLFQEAVRGILELSESFTMDGSRRPSARYLDSAGLPLTASRIDPDFVLTDGAGVTVLDAKYKNALGLGGPDTDLVESVTGPRLRVSRSDLYQLAAYRQHSGWNGAPVALIYPVTVKPGAKLPAPYVVRGLGEPIWLTFIDIGPRAREHIETFLRNITALRPPAEPEASDAPVP
ncbi:MULTISPECIES: hypothetical protein [unclassified Rathayibacter]|uniref:5-methylcytosine restriction system specificity protein McrC n=1 Tax=unclassified Rathayibacter TaxID=2609250 RepID=UPI0015E2FD49|nr:MULTISPECIES: hypothetical protein [unclassified Rathayibacter]